MSSLCWSSSRPIYRPSLRAVTGNILLKTEEELRDPSLPIPHQGQGLPIHPV